MSNKKMNRTTEALSFNELLIEYKVLKRVDPANLAANFTKYFNEKVTECANELYDGDTTELIKYLRNNLVADKKTRLGNIDKYFNGYLPDAAVRIEMVNLIDALLPVNKANASGPKSKWQFTEDDLLALNDAKELQNVINNYASAKAKESMLANAMAHFNLSEEETIARFDELRAFARERIAALKEVKVSDKLVDKLQSGKKVVLSADEVQELLKLVNNK